MSLRDLISNQSTAIQDMLIFVVYWICYWCPDKWHYIRSIELGRINYFVVKREDYIAVNIPTLDVHDRHIKSHGSVSKQLDENTIKTDK